MKSFNYTFYINLWFTKNIKTNKMYFTHCKKSHFLKNQLSCESWFPSIKNLSPTKCPLNATKSDAGIRLITNLKGWWRLPQSPIGKSKDLIRMIKKKLVCLFSFFESTTVRMEDGNRRFTQFLYMFFRSSTPNCFIIHSLLGYSQTHLNCLKLLN